MAFRRATEIEPGQYRNWRALGKFYSKRAHYPEAVLQFQTALKLAPNDRDTRNQIGAAYQNIGHFVLAEKEFRTLLAERETASALNSLGVVLLYERREQEAIPKFARSLQLGPETSLHWMNLGTAYRRSGLSLKSTSAYARGLEVAEAELTSNPRDAVVRANLAFLYAQRNDRRRAEFEIAQALRQAPNDGDVIVEAATTYEALGNRDKTLALLSEAPPAVAADLSRWPDMVGLLADSRFTKMLAVRER